MSPSGREVTAQILESCRRGDRDAFRALYECCKDRVYSLTLHFFHGDSSAAADATQQVFLKLMTTISQYRGDANFQTWLHRLVVNTCIDATRRSNARERQTAPEALERIGVESSQEENLSRAETTSTVRSAISGLPAEFRLPVLLRYFEGLSYDEIAGAMNCSIGTVASRLSRGHKLLASSLASLRERQKGGA